MKKLLLITIYLVFGQLIKAQEYQKFIREDARWIVYENSTEFPETTRYEYLYLFYFKGDTLINDTNYHKLYRSNLKAVNNNYQPPYSIISNTTILNAVLREDEVLFKVYGKFINHDEGHCQAANDLGLELLFYDFSKQVGDTLLQCNIHYQLRSIGKIETSSEFPNKKSFYHASEFNDFILLYTEGIGSPIGPTGCVGCYEFRDIALESYCIIGEDDCGIISSITKYHELEQVNISPNPATSVIFLDNLPAAIKTVEIQNVLGQVVFTTNTQQQSQHSISIDNLPAGLYVLKAYSANHTAQGIQKFIKK